MSSKYGKLHPEIKTKWVEALRSGQFAQGTGRLHRLGRGLLTTDRLCCLGVLCEIALQEGVVVAERTRDSVDYDGETAMPPPDVLDWAFEEEPEWVDGGDAEWSVPFPDVDEDGKSVVEDKSLTELNDNGTTFDEIAALVEQYL